MFTSENYRKVEIITDELLASGSNSFAMAGGAFWDFFPSVDAIKIAIDGAIEAGVIALDFDGSVTEAIEESLAVDGYAIDDDVVATLAIQAINEYNEI